MTHCRTWLKPLESSRRRGQVRRELDDPLSNLIEAVHNLKALIMYTKEKDVEVIAC